ncbi:hypothetical protein RHGRI_003734 [Rhododendron griersonianum]|uniref:Uncharacterized protein n=1 Tax=Rhododendron griersonianum TaxID=479676 RepID=A0AAV6L631_9ERIC|nr:hypothetical protein RHGRI_003734 [Rhododendron griersonianum]
MNCQLLMIDLGRNQLHGLVPRSLANCAMLECLVLHNNKIEDTFPSWLGALPNLELLILGSNKFHGDIGGTRNHSMFPKLRIIDLSCNGFSGNLPIEYIRNWNGMKMINKENFTYMQANPNIQVTFLPSPTSHVPGYTVYGGFSFAYSMRVVSKGTDRLYEKIQIALVVVDLSNNTFIGDIPESFGSLSGLQLLNISNNKLTGAIPPSLVKLTELESLDLSQNLLSGQIPGQLTQLTFLSIFNVSHNRLIGPIPRGKQFDTFDNSSYDGNLGLCGVPLSKSCRIPMTSPPPPPIFRGRDLEFSRVVGNEIEGSFFSATFVLVLPSWLEFRLSITCGLCRLSLMSDCICGFLMITGSCCSTVVVTAAVMVPVFRLQHAVSLFSEVVLCLLSMAQSLVAATDPVQFSQSCTGCCGFIYLGAAAVLLLSSPVQQAAVLSCFVLRWQLGFYDIIWF